jgi:hypothetical protein
MHRTLDVTRQQADVDDLRWGGSQTPPAVAFFAGHAPKHGSLSSRSLRQPLAWRTNNTSKLGCQDFRPADVMGFSSRNRGGGIWRRLRVGTSIKRDGFRRNIPVRPEWTGRTGIAVRESTLEFN